MSKIFEALELARQSRLGQKPSGPPPIPEAIKANPQKSLVVIDDADSLIAECFRFLRSKVTRPAKGPAPRTILITSALQGEGKSFIACNLAATISKSLEEHVLLIDADMRNPAVNRIFGLAKSKEGLSSHLAKDVELSELLLKTAIEKLTILPAGNSTNIPVELLASEKMKGLISEVRDRYRDRYVIIDSPPLELAPESSVIANEVDAVIMVVRYGQTPRHAVKAALDKIPKDRFLGIVFNCYDRPQRIYSRYSYYYKGYGTSS